MIDIEYLRSVATGVPKKHKEKYRKYLASEEWLQLRIDVHIEKGNKCECCSKKSGLQVHHITYDNLFNEDYKDLALLCGRCHKYVHKLCKTPGRRCKRNKKDNWVINIKKIENKITVKDTVVNHRISEIIKDKSIHPTERESIINKLREIEQDFLSKINEVYSIKEDYKDYTDVYYDDSDIDGGTMITLNKEMVDAGLSRNGGFSDRQIFLLTREQKPTKGWRKRLIGSQMSKNRYDMFLSLKDAHLVNKKIAV